MFFMVPESLKAVAMYYDSRRSRRPGDDGRAAGLGPGRRSSSASSGRLPIRLGLVRLRRPDLQRRRLLRRDDGGLAEAFAFSRSLKNAGALVNTTRQRSRRVPEQGNQHHLQRQLDARRLPRRARRPRRWPRSPRVRAACQDVDRHRRLVHQRDDTDQAQLAIAVASRSSARIAAGRGRRRRPRAGQHRPFTSSTRSPLGFADAAAAGLPRPQNATRSTTTGAPSAMPGRCPQHRRGPATAVAEACALMTANGI